MGPDKTATLNLYGVRQDSNPDSSKQIIDINFDALAKYTNGGKLVWMHANWREEAADMTELSLPTPTRQIENYGHTTETISQ